MKKISFVISQQIKLLILPGLFMLVSHMPLIAQTFRVFEVSDLVRIFEDGYKLPPGGDTIKLFGIRGEVISGQFVISAKRNINDVTVEISELRNSYKNTVFPPKSVEWNFVGSIPLSVNTPNQPKSILTRVAPAMYPEYLMEEKKLNIAKGMYKSVWLTINIPPGASQGDYEGKITVKSAEGDQFLPVLLTVYPLTLPEERHLKVTEWYSTNNFERFHGIKERYSKEWFAMLKKYAENMAAHRQNVFQVPVNLIEISKAPDNKFSFDFTRFDQIAEVFWNTGKMDYLETGEMFKWGEKGWGGSEIIHKSYNVKDIVSNQQISMPGEDVLPYLLPAVESHLRQKGWLHKTLFHIKDEPSLHNALAWKEASGYVHHHAPDLIRIDAIETTYLLEDIEIAVPKLDAMASWYDTYKKAKENGVELWYYTVGIYQGSLLPNKTIDMPLIDTRVMHWLNYKYDANGYLHWGWNHWSENPFKEVGMHIGDGWHVYPAKDGVLNSLRWEQMRNGIQDYEYFIMLEKKISALKDSLGSRFSWIDPVLRSKEISGRVIKSFSERSDDPKILYKAKQDVIKELIDFDSDPGIYLQTDPLEGSELTSRSSVEVFGWAEPGTKIRINGESFNVSDQGLFLGKILLSPQLPQIRIQASSEKGTKEIIRNFSVKY